MVQEVQHCKAIAKSTGKPCRRSPIKNGFCRYHLPKDQWVEEEPVTNDADKNPALGKAFLNQNLTTSQKNRFIRVIVVSTKRKKK